MNILGYNGTNQSWWLVDLKEIGVNYQENWQTIAACESQPKALQGASTASRHKPWEQSEQTHNIGHVAA